MTIMLSSVILVHLVYSSAGVCIKLSVSLCLEYTIDSIVNFAQGFAIR